MQETVVSLLTTKLYIPSPRPNLAPRPELMQRLDETLRLQHALTLVSAKAGSGKTTAVSQWLHRRECAAAWLSLDTHDDEPRRFLRYLIAALCSLGVEVGQGVLGQLESPRLAEPDALLVTLVNDLAALSASFALVIDDYYLIQDEWIHQAITFLAEHQPPQMHLILVTRSDPPLPLARLRARGQLVEVRDRDLRFTETEVAWLANEMLELELPAKAVSTLEQRTEGWAVGVQMALLAMQARLPMHRDDRPGALSAFVEAFGGTYRYILDYLMEEVLGQQPQAIQDFLIETCILERMCGPLCDAVRSGPHYKLGGDEAVLHDGQ